MPIHPPAPIPLEAAQTLPALLRARVRHSPDGCAYRRFDPEGHCSETVTWTEVEKAAARWQAALRKEGVQAGERVALMLHNSLEWVLFDLAALGLGLVTVPLYFADRPENFAFILEQTEARVLLIEGPPHWTALQEVWQRLGAVERIVAVAPVPDAEGEPRLAALADWLPDDAPEYAAAEQAPDALASILYTSGTTGNPKGVMLSHRNMLSNAHACASMGSIRANDLFLSFLPLSHALERTVGYYLPMVVGAAVAHVRSLERLGEDFAAAEPTVIVCVPRIFERILQRVSGQLDKAPAWRRKLFELTVEVGWRRFLYRQKRAAWSVLFLLWPLLDRLVGARLRAALGGRVRLAICGGAPLSPDVARVFLAVGVNLLQGYGLTETSPVVSGNAVADNRPETVGKPLPGVEVRLADNGELLVKGPGVMLGYWRDPEATRTAIDAEGWFHTGDVATIDADGFIRITGRIKDIIVLANGEKVPPADLEHAIAADHLFEHVLVVGERRPYLAALVVLNRAKWEKLARKLRIDPRRHDIAPGSAAEHALLERIGARMARFPGYARIHRVGVIDAPWDVSEGLLTATLKVRRARLLDKFAAEIERLYEGH